MSRVNALRAESYNRPAKTRNILLRNPLHQPSLSLCKAPAGTCAGWDCYDDYCVLFVVAESGPTSSGPPIQIALHYRHHPPTTRTAQLFINQPARSGMARGTVAEAAQSTTA